MKDIKIIKTILNEVMSNIWIQVLVLILTIINFFSFDLYGKLAIVIVSIIIFISVFKKELSVYNNFQNNVIHLPIVINFDPSKKASLQNILHKIAKINKISLKDLKNYLLISQEDLIFNFEGGVRDTERIKKFYSFLKHDISQLNKKIPSNSNIHYHIVIIGKVGYGFLTGIVFSNTKFTFYQYDTTNDTYNVKIELNNRKIFEKKELQCSQKEEKINPQSNEIDVLLNYSSKSVAERNDNYIKLTSKKQTLETTDEFIDCAREIYTILDDIQKNGKSIKLYYSMPLGLAFLLGYLIKTHWDITLMQFVNGEYVNFMNLKEFKV